MSYLLYLRDKVRYNPLPRVFFDGLAKLGVRIQLFYLIQEGISKCPSQQKWNTLEGYEVGFLEAEDMTTIAQIPYRWVSYDKLQSWLKDGRHCLGAKREGRLAAFTWFDLNCCDFGGCRFQLNDDEAYLFDAFTVSDSRGKGLAPALRYRLYEELAWMGRTKLYSITDCFNAPALKFKQKLGARIVKSGWHVTLFKKWHFGSRSDHP